MKIPGLKSSSILINWSLSYISILLIPIIISMAVYVAAGNILKKEITRTNIQLLNQIKSAIDSRLQDIEKTGLQLSFNQNIRSLRGQNNDVDTIASYNSVIRDLRVYKLSNSFVDNFFIYLKDNRCAISSNTYLSENYFMENTGGYKEIDKNQWKRDILRKDSTGFTPLLLEANKKYSSAIAYTKPVFLGNSISPEALLIITIENSKLLESISNIKLEDKSSIFVIDKNNVIISSRSQRELSTLIKYSNLSADSGIIQTVQENEKLTVSFASSDVTDWKYVSVIPTDVFSEKTDSIRKLTKISVLLSLVIGFFVMLLWVKLNYNPMGRLIKALSTSSGLINDKKINEFKFIQDAIEHTNDEKQRVLKDLRSQSTIVRSNQLIKLLKGKMNFDGQVFDTLLKNDIRFETEFFVVFLFYIEQSSEFFSDSYGLNMSLKEKQELARFIISNIIEELACQENYGLATEIDDMVACIVNLKAVEDEKAVMKELFRIVSYTGDNEINGFCDNAFLEELDPINRLTNCHTVFDMKRHLEDILSDVCKYIKDNRKNEHSQIKERVMEFVNENYKDANLNISMISEYIDITPAYLSRLFKEQSSMALLDYINKVRLERAKELLKGTKSNINDIANEIGFQNTNTFIRIFKKYEGVTPGKYKESFTREI